MRHIGLVTPKLNLPEMVGILQRDLELADPEFRRSRGVDIVLGANIYHQLLLPGTKCVGSLLAQKTVFGWTLTGTVPEHKVTVREWVSSSNTNFDHESEYSGHEKLVDLVQRFWNDEDVPETIRRSQVDLECDNIYKSGYSRASDGRYTVSLPIKPQGLQLLGESQSQARSALASTHRRMMKDHTLRKAYCEFMDEYLRLGHMRPLTSQEKMDSSFTYHYIPHHGIWQRGDEERKLRVVFNASRPTSTGKSLNDILYSGPKLQNDLPGVISRWRRYRIAFCADIQKMFRQIQIDPRHAHLQRILWSPSSDVPETHYVLTTVTYGTTCAPYLALKTLMQLCEDEGDPFPEAVEIIKKELYMDDFLSGADDLESTRRRQDQLRQLLATGGFDLKKWVSTHPDLLANVPPADCPRPSWLHLTTNGPVNELGLAWDPVKDVFRFQTPQYEATTPLTKRRALSELAKFFDPVGWLAPLTVIAKMAIQDMWLVKLGWDERLPKTMQRKWHEYRQSSSTVHTISIPRWIGSYQKSSIQLHAFADASCRAMAAAVYSRVESNDEVHCALIQAKTKLAPMRGLKTSSKMRPTIPRLELRAILLAARLLKSIIDQLEIPQANHHLWSDSKVALQWASSNDPVGHNVIDNYVAHIQEIVPNVIWHYVPTSDNPADIASRGADVSHLLQSRLWWKVPKWLGASSDSWPQLPSSSHSGSTDNRLTPILINTTSQVLSDDDHPIGNFSDLGRLLRAIVRCRRLLLSKSPDATSPMASMTASELHQAFLTCTRLSQQLDFGPELERLHQTEPVRIKSKLRRLDPFLDDSGVLRVGGRLTNSNLPFEEKHPVILKRKCHLARLIIAWAHAKSLHGGFRATYCCVLQRAWIIGGRVAVKAYLRTCPVCVRLSAKPMTQRMASLPGVRLTPSRPFERCGLDYAGPFSILRSKGRGIASSKGYIALFICLSTKAIHLELAGDLTTESFLGALSRFSGRRGRPSEIWSDNGSNFRGANLELTRLLRAAELDWGLVKGHLASEGIDWKFIPPSAPHFGGIWEAGVKSAKTHLKRILGPRKLTYEEFNTLLVEVEMILNCRPLTPLSGDLDDIDALTPAHFLIGSSLTSIPRPSYDDRDVNHYAHWKLVRCLRDQFWCRWSKEYLNTLQQRVKWTRPRSNVLPGDLVILLDPSLLKPNGKWPLGRILEVHPGSDGLTRVATVKTESGSYTRPLVKLARFPIEKYDSSVEPDQRIHPD